MVMENKPKGRKRRGRPPGAKTATRDVAEQRLSRCRCGSTERGDYERQETLPLVDDPDGFTHVRLQWTKCSDCGQARVDRTKLAT